MELLLIGVIFELIIIIIGFLLLSLILKKYYEKRHKLTFLLFIIFLNFVISIIFSWLSKVLRFFSGLEYLSNPNTPDPGTIASWFLLRIVDFRFTFLFVSIATIFTYQLYIELFEKQNFVQKIIVYIYEAFTVFYLMFIYQKGNALLLILAFLFTCIYSFMISIPFMVNCIKTRKSVNEKSYKNAFLSLIVMSICTLLVLVCQLIDRLFIIFFKSPGYTLFYFLAWIFAIIGIYAAYLGYIKPKSRVQDKIES